MNDIYHIREYQPNDENAVVALLQQNMDSGNTGTWNQNFWRWKHVNNPFGPSIGFVAVNNTGQIVGFQTFMRWRFKTGNTVIKAVRSVDTITNPEYRRYGISSALNHKAFDQMEASGIEFIFGTPNDQFLPGQMKWGFTYVALCQPLVKILNYPRFLAGYIRNRKERGSTRQSSPEKLFRDKLPTMAEFIGNSEEINRLLQSGNQSDSQPESGHLFTDRSLDYLRWRYSECPRANYVVFNYKKDSALSGCAILRPNSRFGLKEVVLSELLLSQPDKALASSLMHEIKRSLSADYIIAYYPHGSFEHRLLRSHGFLKVPVGGMHFTVNVFNKNPLCDPRDLRNWDLSLGDLEIF
jgi:hypothetical protein